MQGSLNSYRLTARVGEEKLIPRSGLEQDLRFFDLDSLVRMYGREDVERYLGGRVNDSRLQRVRKVPFRS